VAFSFGSSSRSTFPRKSLITARDKKAHDPSVLRGERWNDKGPAQYTKEYATDTERQSLLGTRDDGRTYCRESVERRS
jgi:hypothetical protein